MSKQTTPSSCGLYSVAEVLERPGFITDARMLASIDYGANIGILNKWMQQDGMSMYLQPIFFNKLGSIPDGYLTELFGSLVPKTPFRYMPILIVISCGNIDHMISLRVTPESKFDSIDPNIVAVYAFCDLHTGQYAFIS